MTNTKLFLLFGTSLSLIPTITFAQCVATQDCATLGYTENSCSGGNGVKCPFGNKWACFKSESEIKQELEKEFCNEYGFTLTCTGTGETGGIGKACNGKYTECKCATGYEWKDSSCQKQTPTEGAVGNMYYCDGRIVGIRTNDMNFFVAIENAKNSSSETSMNWNTANTQAARAFCGKGRLPTQDELKLIYNNKSTINSLSTASGGQDLINGNYWTSNNYYFNGGYSYAVSMSDGKVSNRYGSYANVRPVLAF